MMPGQAQLLRMLIISRLSAMRQEKINCRPDNTTGRQWSIAESWQLIAQLPFGKPTAPAGEKPFKPIEERVKIFK
ncbi:putative oxidoreductase (fatty acid repression mutant protein) [Paenibacillus harenae]|uniref:Oxidoreductase (Fatty acid repression mutant protein) n=1 Tax=Paenibacillus harenae TaxID=306543 RepID=A0ABT9TZP5_PAEHA|nr:putative oxidoreductase (fatty acid repression mutant protein) [Paenibacillus harenae]